jgi:hypothetical protein
MNRRRKRIREERSSPEEGNETPESNSSGSDESRKTTLSDKKEVSSGAQPARRAIEPRSVQNQARKSSPRSTPAAPSTTKESQPAKEDAPETPEKEQPKSPEMADAEKVAAPSENKPASSPPAAREETTQRDASPAEKPVDSENAPAEPIAASKNAPTSPAAALSEKKPAPASDEKASAEEDAAEGKLPLRRRLAALSVLEKASLGILTVALLAFTIWATSSVAATIPENPDTKSADFPVAGESAVLASVETFWRKPVRSGEDIDEGVSRDIELIPGAKITLAKNSKAKGLRVLFRDEEGRYAGDATTLRIADGKFVDRGGNTSRIEGRTASVRATTGFLHEGEIISYLSDDNFQWHLVLLESGDGSEFKEFLAIPISARKKD